MQRLPSQVIKRRRQLFSQTELAKRLGVHLNTVWYLEKRPLPDLLIRYLAEVGYNITFNPKRKKRGV